jgi:hypothetical protein
MGAIKQFYAELKGGAGQKFAEKHTQLVAT